MRPCLTALVSEDALIRLTNLKALGHTPTDLVRLAGNSYPYWRDLLAGEKSFGEKAARSIETKLGLPRGCLDTTDGCGGRKVSETAVVYQIASKQADVTLKQWDTGGAMGHGLVLQDQPGVIQSWKVTREWLQKNVPYSTTPDNLAIVTGFGDSMVGMFNPGDPLIVDTGITKADVDGVYFFRVGEEGFIKRLQRIPGEGIVVISENSKYRDWTIKEGMDFEVFAKVLKVWRSQNL